MIDLWRTVFSPQQFMPHGHCYLWQSNLVGLHVLADGLIAIAYYSIPIMLLYFVRQRQNVPFRRIFILFSAFIITCGTTHVISIWTLWHPAYWLSGCIKALTALVSVYTALELYPVIPQALAMPSQEELKEINQSLQQEITERKAAESELKSQRDFNQLIAEVMSDFVDLAPQHLDGEIERILNLIGEFADAQFSYVFKFSEDYQAMSMTHEWSAPGMDAQKAKAQQLPWEAFPWSNQKYMDREILYIPNVDDLPPDAAIDQANWQQFNIVSLLATPLIQNKVVTGFMGFASFTQPITWDEEAVRTLKTVSQAVANVQERIQASQKLRDSEARFRQVVESIQEIFFIRDFPSFTLQYASPVIETITGLSLKDLYADPFLMVKHMHPEDRDRAQEAIHSLEQSNDSPLDLEFRFNRPDGNMRWIRAKIFPLKAEDGRIYRLIGVGEDVTQEKRAEQDRIQNQKLKLELNLLENILDIILAGYWDWDIPNNAEYLSPGFKRMFGYEDDELPNAPETWQQLIFPEDLPTVLECFEEHVRTKGQIPYYNEVRYRHKDGSTVWVACSGEMIEWGPDGQPLRMIGCHIDITKQKLAQEELQQKALIFENSSDGIIVTNLKGRITDWNRAAVEMFGYAKEDVLGRSPSILHHLHEAPLLTQHILDGMEQEGKWQGEVNFIRKDGSEGTCETIVVPLVDEVGTMVATLGVNRDITARKEAESALKMARYMLDRTKDAVFFIDHQGKFLYVNNAACQHLGYSAYELLTMGVSDIDPAYSMDVWPLTWRELKQQGNLTLETTQYHRDGHEIPVEVSANFVEIEGAEYDFAVVKDISDRKAREAQIQADLAEKEVMLQEIHHRVKNNLQIVSSLLNLQAKRIQNPDLSEILVESQTRVRSMALLHEKLYRSPNLSQIHFGDYVQDLTRTLLRTYRTPEAVIKLNTNIEEIYLPIDVAMPCGLIINELVSNALKYAFSGQNEGRVAIWMDRQPQCYRLGIEDDGVGFPSSLDWTRATSLGLQMVQTLAQQLSGTIDIQSEQGTQILLQFPL